jgi:phage-related protein (TIGR01555 family)
MLADSSQAVLKVTGLLELLGDGQTSEAFADRMRVLDLGRAIRILPLDAENESFEVVERAFSGVPDILDRVAGMLAGASDTPQTVLFGRSPAGMNATGESDMRIWYDSIRAAQEAIYKPIFEEILYYICLTNSIQDAESWGIEFPSLWTPTETEALELKKKQADIDKIYLDASVVTTEDVASRLSS